ncbi:MAG: hypothetical protein A3H93_06045 [Rhodocyclales bacterium RIFCSPLOWO2_02_FULL_63_24]|nr:MAG: hypothetical protein A2040_12705 [Rhodocyclales bacterium GWA2_65_19]OHC68304.1 MAG: hypothetical protein A3H93_06045 [Rhodocyclales bacterium RIFCSPLOWO2_02_FULL_63_24]
MVLGALLGWSASAAAASAILPFGADTWSELQRSSARPMAVVFSTTDCTHCPGVIDGLAAVIKKSRSGVRLVVVVMDGAGQEDALRQDRHYRNAHVLYAFDGDALALRFKVNPDWRGLTPYVALLPASGAAQFHTGAPPPDALRSFLLR